ncbi:MAG: hypothetical protein IT449_01610 [Phycisphaerales bacterium]|nr:hypothetical protein [Phycisphaerales bacterium]
MQGEGLPMCAIVTGLWLWCAGAVQQGEGKPLELLQAERYRARINTARIEWCSHGGTSDSSGGQRYFTSRIAGQDDLYIRRGMADGRMHERAEIGRPLSYNESRLLLKDGEQWSYAEETLTAQVVQDSSRFSLYNNLRDLGFEPSPVSSSEAGFWFRTAASGYDIERGDDRVLITGHWDNGFSVQWTLDPAQGLQPVHTAVLVEGETVDACSTTYDLFDDIWFPSHSEFTHKGEVTSTFVILEAEFNRPEHPGELTPIHLGLIDGIRIHRPALGDMVWCGDQLIPEDDYFRRVREGTADNSGWEAMRMRNLPLGPGAFPKACNDDFLGLTVVLTRTPGLWEDYTRRFIQRFQLKPNQAQHAWKTLKECQKPAYAYLDEHEKDVKEVRVELAGFDAKPSDSQIADSKTGESNIGDPKTSDSKTHDADALKRKAALEERLEKLHAPIDKIFNEKLKPGLAKLPSQEQIDAAREAEAARDKAIASAKPADGK